MSADLPAAGELFEEKYRIEEQIGSGGFAAVFRATDEATQRVVAIKILVPLDHETNYSDRLVARYEREARLLARLKSQHTVTMYEFGRSESGFLYLVFEYVDGTTLSRLVGEHGRQSPQRVVHVLRQVCTALQEAHQLGILHRDIKPANIMLFDHLDVKDVVKLLDFGIAKPIGTEDEDAVIDEATITSDGALLGTPRYMSPEQIAHQKLTPASDIYSLGLVVYELLTGDRAVSPESATGVIREQLSERPIEFPRNSTVPVGLRRVVERMVNKQRSRRYQNVGDILSDLKTWDETELRSPLVFVAVAGLLFGLALLAGAFLVPDRQVKQPRAERPVQTMGAPLFEVPMNSPDLTFIWIASSKTWNLKGTTDPREIPDLARIVVAVERDGVTMKPGTRFVADLTDWDGKSLDYTMVVREVDEHRYRAMVKADMSATVQGRQIARNAQARVLGKVLSGGKQRLKAGSADMGSDDSTPDSDH